MVQPEKLLWIAEQHGHSVAVMLKDYAAWTKGAKDSDVAVIRAAMQAAPGQLLKAA
jgi:flavorubredoxin